MHVKLKWAVHSLKSDKGVVSPETAKKIARLAAELDVSPEDVARSWLDCVCEIHEDPCATQIAEGAFETRVETMRFSRSVIDALERARIRDDDSISRSGIIEQMLHEKFLLDDPVYAEEWLLAERRRFESERFAEERARVLAKRSKGGSV